MQYEFTLPADYNMGIIRERVATKGHLLDAFPGLGFKAYLLRERGVDRSPVNQYAPFYLWRTGEGMNEFLWGAGFRGVGAAFGRPPVQHWLGAGFRPGPAADLTPRTATRTVSRIPESADPAEAVAEALGELGDRPGLHSSAVAVDPRRWELLRFALWHDQTPEDRDHAPADHGQAPVDAARYQVLHFSRPEFDALPTTKA